MTTSNGSDVCISCPANSVSISADSRECLCIQGYYRSQLEDVHIGCTSKLDPFPRGKLRFLKFGDVCGHMGIKLWAMTGVFRHP